MGKHRPFTAFSENGDIVASVHRGNRMKWWRRDADGKDSEIYGFVGKNVVYSCLCFARDAAGNDEVVVVGTEDGRVEVFDLGGAKLSSSKPFKSLGHKGAISALCPTKPSSTRPGSIFVASERCPSVAEISIRDGTLRSSFKADKEGVRRVAVSEDHIVIASPSKLKAFNFDHECRAKYPIGAMRAVTSLCVQLDSVCVSDGCSVCVWDIKTNVSVPVKGNFSKEGNLEGLQFFASAKWLVGRIATFIYVWQVNEKDVKEHRRLVAPTRVLGIRAVGDEKWSLIAVLGDLQAPKFDSFDALTGNFSAVAVPDTNKENDKQQVNAIAAPVALGVHAASKKRLRPSELQTDKRLQQIVAKRQKLWEQERKEIAHGGAVSYSAVINQWHKTMDTRDLESCYRISTVSVIRRTVQDLSAPVAWKFLLQCGNKLMQYPFLVHSLTAWVRQIFDDHAAYILSQGSEKKRLLLPLQIYLRQRMTSGELLHRLHGKLELLTHLAENRIVARTKKDITLGQTALVQYKEGNEDVPDEDVADDDEDAADAEHLDEEDDLADLAGFNPEDLDDDDFSDV